MSSAVLPEVAEGAGSGSQPGLYRFWKCRGRGRRDRELPSCVGLGPVSQPTGEFELEWVRAPPGFWGWTAAPETVAETLLRLSPRPPGLSPAPHSPWYGLASWLLECGRGSGNSDHCLEWGQRASQWASGPGTESEVQTRRCGWGRGTESTRTRVHKAGRQAMPRRWRLLVRGPWTEAGGGAAAGLGWPWVWERGQPQGEPRGPRGRGEDGTSVGQSWAGARDAGAEALGPALR